MPPPPDVLVVAAATEPVSLNPLYLEGSSSYMVSELGYSYLTNYDADGRIVADTAASVPTLANGGISRQGKLIIYHLRRDARWQDGAPLTSRDVVFTYRAIMNASNTVPSRDPYDRIADVRSPDPNTIVVELKKPYSAIVPNFFGGDSNYPILPAHLLAAYASLDKVPYNQAPIGSGPYRFTKWARGNRLDLISSKRYFSIKPTIHRISIRFVHDSVTIANELLTGEVDATFFADVSKIAALRAIPNHRVIVTPVPYFSAAIFNVTDPILSDEAVRRAFALAIDRHMIVGKVAHGLYDADTGMRGMFTWAFDPKARTLPYNPDRAKALLARDGWALGSDGFRIKGGRRLEIQLAFYSSFMASVVPLIIEEERAVGIAVTSKQYSDSSAIDSFLYQGRFQVALYDYQASLDPEPSALLSCDQRAPHGFNWARYCNPAVDRAIERAASVFYRAARRRAYSFIQRQLITDMPIDFLWQVSEVDVIPSNLRGFDRPLLSPYNSVARWRW